MSAPGDAESLVRLRRAFEDNFQLGRECGAALSVWKDGCEKLALHGGYCDAARKRPWTPQTIVLVWSATKGPASACLLRALHETGLETSVPVAEVWPEFAAEGKASITVAAMLSHCAGLCAVADRSLHVLDHDAVARCLSAQAPAWPPGDGHAYSPRAFGYVLEEMIRRLTGKTCGQYWRSAFGEPFDLDFWIGLPESEHNRAADALAPRASAMAGEKTPFARELSTPGTLTNAAFSAPAGITGPTTMNSPAMRSACLPAFGGIGSASALAKFYGLLATSEPGLLPQEILAACSRPLSNGFDRVLHRETAFSTGFMLDPRDSHNQLIRRTFGSSPSAFGHPGAGGSLAFADPENRIGFAYVMNQMEPGALPRERTQRLVRALYGI